MLFEGEDRAIEIGVECAFEGLDCAIEGLNFAEGKDSAIETGVDWTLTDFGRT